MLGTFFSNQNFIRWELHIMSLRVFDIIIHQDHYTVGSPRNSKEENSISGNKRPTLQNQSSCVYARERDIQITQSTRYRVKIINIHVEHEHRKYLVIKNRGEDRIHLDYRRLRV